MIRERILVKIFFGFELGLKFKKKVTKYLKKNLDLEKKNPGLRKKIPGI